MFWQIQKHFLSFHKLCLAADKQHHSLPFDIQIDTSEYHITGWDFHIEIDSLPQQNKNNANEENEQELEMQRRD